MPIHRGPDGKFAKAKNKVPPRTISTNQPDVSEQIIKAYKGYKSIDGKLWCRSHRFEPGRRDVLKESGPEDWSPKKLELCKYGFHACKNLWDVFDFYELQSPSSVFSEVTLFGKTVSDNKKIAALKILPEAPMHWAHITNRLALEVREGRENGKLFVDVQLDTSKPGTHIAKTQILTSNPQAGEEFQQVANSRWDYVVQLCTKADITQINNNPYGGRQIAAANRITQFSTKASQVMAGNNGTTIFKGYGGNIEVLGKDCAVHVIGTAKIKATEGTKISLQSKDHKISITNRAVTKDEEGQWLEIRDITPATPKIFDLTKRK